MRQIIARLASSLKNGVYGKQDCGAKMRRSVFRKQTAEGFRTAVDVSGGNRNCVLARQFIAILLSQAVLNPLSNGIIGMWAVT